jgi:hypothetical protein
VGWGDVSVDASLEARLHRGFVGHVFAVEIGLDFILELLVEVGRLRQIRLENRVIGLFGLTGEVVDGCANG